MVGNQSEDLEANNIAYTIHTAVTVQNNVKHRMFSLVLVNRNIARRDPSPRSISLTSTAWCAAAELLRFKMIYFLRRRICTAVKKKKSGLKTTG